MGFWVPVYNKSQNPEPTAGLAHHAPMKGQPVTPTDGTAATLTPETQPKSPRKAALASWIGSALEYYDFAVYGTAAALVLNKIFFPEDSPAIGILKSMIVIGVAYIVRPFGAMIMGPLGDRYGRRFVLMLTLFLMGGATFAIGCLPTYSQVGLLAPILLVFCRMVQGLSAAGEQSSAISVSLEHAPENRRAFITSWTLQGTQFGSLIATAIYIPFTSMLSEEQLLSWGWRVPFWLSALVVVTAYIIRRRLAEPPAYLNQVRDGVPPLKRVFMHHKRAVVTVALCAMVNTVNMVFTTFALSYATKGHGLSQTQMLIVPVASNAVGLLMIPVAAVLADRFGRKPVFITGALTASLIMYPYLQAIAEHNWVGIFGFGMLMHGALYSLANGVWPVFYAEMFPTSVRVTGLALGTQIGFALSGGIAPWAATIYAGPALQDAVGPSIFVVAMCLLVVVAAWTAPEGRGKTLAELDESLAVAKG